MNFPHRWRSFTAAALLVTSALGASACTRARRPDGGEGLLAAPTPAPNFEALDQDGRTRTLAEFRGRPVVLYFYPRDATPGCTREACAFRDAWDRFARVGAQVLGVSSDDVASHARFAREHNLPFPLLADTEGRLMQSYGVGRTLGMAARVTFVIGPDGRIVRVFPNVDPAVHADEVLQVIEALRGPTG
jgi:peroxiredoxin Q/BCP